jgi:hypothetical protein
MSLVLLAASLAPYRLPAGAPWVLPPLEIDGYTLDAEDLRIIASMSPRVGGSRTLWSIEDGDAEGTGISIDGQVVSVRIETDVVSTGDDGEITLAEIVAAGQVAWALDFWEGDEFIFRIQGDLDWLTETGGFTGTATSGQSVTVNLLPDTPVTVNVMALGEGGAMTGSAILAALLPVDGTGSALDADLLDGNHAAAFATAAQGALAGTAVQEVMPALVYAIKTAADNYEALGVRAGTYVNGGLVTLRPEKGDAGGVSRDFRTQGGSPAGGFCNHSEGLLLAGPSLALGTSPESVMIQFYPISSGVFRMMDSGASAGASIVLGDWVNATSLMLKPDGTTLKLRLADDSADAPLTAGHIAASGSVTFPSYTVATFPDAAAWVRRIIYISDEAGGATMAFSDGTNWRRMADRAIVS